MLVADKGAGGSMISCKEAKESRSMDDELEIEDMFVLDTSVIIDDPDIFFNLGRKWIIVPTVVIRELDGLKRSSDTKRSGAARKASKTLDNLGYRQDIAFGAITSAGSVVRIFNRHIMIDGLASAADNHIVGSAIRLQIENKHCHVVLITNDRNMRNVSRSYGIQAEQYPLRVGETDSRTMKCVSDVTLFPVRKVA
jgi:PhoH-like ATPase